MKDDKKRKKLNKSFHPFDVWPPPRKKIPTDQLQVEKPPQNVSYKDPEEYLDAPPEPVYDTESQKEIEQEDKDEEEDKNAEAK